MPSRRCWLAGERRPSPHHLHPARPPAGTLPLRISPSKTPVRIDSRRNADAQQRGALPQLGLPVGGVPALPALHPHAQVAHPLNPALLMAVAGFNVPMAGYPPHFPS